MSDRTKKKRRPRPYKLNRDGNFMPPPEISDMAIDVMIREALRGCTQSEKLLIATILPEFLEAIRQKPGTANAEPNAEPNPPEGKQK
jgi:hypothetical protein